MTTHYGITGALRDQTGRQIALLLDPPRLAAPPDGSHRFARPSGMIVGMTDDKQRDRANGSAFRPSGAKVIGAAVADALADALPQAISQALAARQDRACALCLLRRIAWEEEHKADMDAALVRAAGDAGLRPAEFLQQGGDPLPFLPHSLKPGSEGGMPPVNTASTALAGTDLCLPCLPAARRVLAPGLAVLV